MPFEKGRYYVASRTDHPDRVAREMLLTGTPEYWIGVCDRAIQYLMTRIRMSPSADKQDEKRSYSLINQYREVRKSIINITGYDPKEKP